MYLLRWNKYNLFTANYARLKISSVVVIVVMVTSMLCSISHNFHGNFLQSIEQVLEHVVGAGE